MGAPNSAGAFRHYYSINNNNDDGVLKQNMFFVLRNVNQTVAGLIFNTTSQFIYDRLYKKWLSLIFSNSHCMKNGNCLTVIYNLMIGLPRNNKNTPFKVSKQLVQDCSTGWIHLLPPLHPVPALSHPTVSAQGRLTEAADKLLMVIKRISGIQVPSLACWLTERVNLLFLDCSFHFLAKWIWVC